MAIFGKRFKNETEESGVLSAVHTDEEPKEGQIEPANIPLDEDGDPIRREKVLLFYNPYSGNGLFKSNLDLISNGSRRTDFRSHLSVPPKAIRSTRHSMKCRFRTTG
jgi:hypothetical protein